MWKRLVDFILQVMSRCCWTAGLSDKWRWKLEDSGFFSIYSRLIVVCGMARTATSATAAYVGSHPKVNLIVSGELWYRAENDLIGKDIDWGKIDDLLRKYRPNRVLIKNPWLERYNAFFEKVQDAKVIVCYRRPETLFQSWHVSWMAGRKGRDNPQLVYDDQLVYCDQRLEEGALRVNKELIGPQQSLRIGGFLGLDPEGFDADRIRQKWMGLREREWLENNTIWLKEGGNIDNDSDLLPVGNRADDGQVPRGDTTVYEN